MPERHWATTGKLIAIAAIVSGIYYTTVVDRNIFIILATVLVALAFKPARRIETTPIDLGGGRIEIFRAVNGWLVRVHPGSFLLPYPDENDTLTIIVFSDPTDLEVTDPNVNAAHSLADLLEEVFGDFLQGKKRGGINVGFSPHGYKQER